MKKVFLHIIILVFATMQFSIAQKIVNPDFDKKVDRIIGYKVPVISVEDAHCDTLLQYVYLDAREKEEFDISHISGARYIGYDNFNISSVVDLPKDAPIIVYCSIGYRSDKIGNKLKKAGYTNVLNLYGSIFEWANRDFLIVDDKDNPTKRLHTYNKKWSRWVDNPEIIKIW